MKPRFIKIYIPLLGVLYIITEPPKEGWSTDQLCKIAIIILLGLNLNSELGALTLI